MPKHHHQNRSPSVGSDDSPRRHHSRAQMVSQAVRDQHQSYKREFTQLTEALEEMASENKRLESHNAMMQSTNLAEEEQQNKVLAVRMNKMKKDFKFR